MNIYLSEILKDVKTVAIGGHLNPDGDATGSCMALYLYLKKNFPHIQADVYLENIQPSFVFLTDIDTVNTTPKLQSYDLFVALDCGDLERLGFLVSLFEQAKKTLNIDHHVSNQGFADYNLVVPAASSTAELVYGLIMNDQIQRNPQQEQLDKQVAEAVYLGLIHDTGVFRYPSTSPQTMEIAANLIRSGINGPRIIDETYFEKSFGQVKILGRAIEKAQLYLDNTCIASVITAEDRADFGLDTHDLDGIINVLKGTRGCYIAIFMYQLNDDTFKVSLRSNETFDVNAIASHFGGGGHLRAAGLTMSGKTPEQMLEALFVEINKQV